ncbi:type II secretion system protein L [Luteimonas padinae]|uniref:Type II secretion system protein GspL n=1 Tax=Luteimonas padinae TaxID=1714359 RepID=A0ABV6SXT3_9GAMM|nr:type II secretion system protein GspL [Luteimonas padinae]GHD65050.1 type II secretion system protein L [Luteimonas padinae]
MSKRILFLPADPAAPATLLDVDDGGRVLSRRSLRAGDSAATGAGPVHGVLVVPGDAVRIDTMELPAHSAAQAQAAAAALLAARLARPTTLHVALDPAGTSTRRTMAAVDPALLRAWLERAAASGFMPDAAVPEQLLLPAPDDDAPVNLLDAGDRWLARGPGLAFAAEPALAAQVLGTRPVSRIEGGLDALAGHALAPELDLLQGEFAPAARRARPANRRRLAWLAAALLASPLLLVAAQALRLELAARALESRAAATLDAALPGSGGDAAGLDRRLQAAHAPREFAAASGALFAAVDARPGTHLVDLEYARGDRLRARLFHRDAADLEALRGSLAADGWRLVEGGSTEVAGGLHTGLALEPSA